MTAARADLALAPSLAPAELLIHLAHLELRRLELRLGLLLPLLLADLTGRLVAGAVAGRGGDRARVLDRLLVAVPERLEVGGAPVLL